MGAERLWHEFGYGAVVVVVDAVIDGSFGAAERCCDDVYAWFVGPGIADEWGGGEKACIESFWTMQWYLPFFHTRFDPLCLSSYPTA